ncbi:DUF4142 domain-containing protein [uncultured Pontibacter sp.]|uniref:DUF4142 domain-containing protein n=1 Tax=uncultured Pontibacter sp. TaxID=453356 RepID=UPI00262A39FA|nr:DUF4142 domain-containing protein [uncultured Pontibacter sp.]
MLLDKLLTFALATLFLIALSCEGPASETENQKDVPQKRTLQHEPAFWDYAASSNMLQVEIGKVAAEKGTSSQIRTFAAEAVNFHNKALEDLKVLAQQHNNIQLPDSLGAADLGLVLEFKMLEGEELDMHFREFVISTHNAQLKRYEEALLKAENPKTRIWLMDMRTHLQEEINSIAQADVAEAEEE